MNESIKYPLRILEPCVSKSKNGNCKFVVRNSAYFGVAKTYALLSTFDPFENYFCFKEICKLVRGDNNSPFTFTMARIVLEDDNLTVVTGINAMPKIFFDTQFDVNMGDNKAQFVFLLEDTDPTNILEYNEQHNVYYGRYSGQLRKSGQNALNAYCELVTIHNSLTPGELTATKEHLIAVQVMSTPKKLPQKCFVHFFCTAVVFIPLDLYCRLHILGHTCEIDKVESVPFRQVFDLIQKIGTVASRTKFDQDIQNFLVCRMVNSPTTPDFNLPTIVGNQLGAGVLFPALAVKPHQVEVINSQAFSSAYLPGQKAGFYSDITSTFQNHQQISPYNTGSQYSESYDQTSEMLSMVDTQDYYSDDILDDVKTE
eukprot:TRINITY_DN2337_c0_g2_i1.p1 TRINITY_DN2337_c0_g2~~TRINITY_DN2337_c0_g2_i1.p1  ORF type:complete len:381 (+),score=97.84 TRINITY_DN2337_c0_g2_i1:34-1143(+)